MLCALAFHPGDAQQAKKLLEWIGELGHAQNHELLLGWSMNAGRAGLAPPLVEIAKRAFKTVYEFPFYDEDERGHPMSANHAWLSCARQIANPHPKVLPVPQPWLWLEPDAVPLVSTWLDRIEAEYTLRDRPFMGDIIPANEARGVQRRPSGVGVYPWNVPYQEKILRLDTRAWDDFLAEDILPYHFQTALIQDMYCMSRDPDVEPTFPFSGSLELVSKEAVLFHRNSDQSLIDRLREKKGGDALCANREKSNLRPLTNDSRTILTESSGITGVLTDIIPSFASNGVATSDPEAAQIALLKAENAMLLERLEKLEKRSTAKPKKKRSVLEQAKINLRMEKLRAAKAAK